MKHTYLIFISFFLVFQQDVSGQLPNGSIAPNWTLTDIEGNTYTLYDYLDQGKMVVLDFGETRCLACWEYLNSGNLETFWEEHGPDGADDAMIFFIESAWETGMNDLLGLTEYSYGNWIAACPFPLIDLAPGNNTGHDYNVTYYPTIYAVCHDHTLYELGMVPTQDWVDFLQSCNMEVEVADLDIAICAGDGSVSVEPTGGFSPYTYQWDNGVTLPTISGLISGNYDVTVTEGNGKISTLEVFVPGATEPLTLSDEVEPTLCFGSADGNIFIDVDGGIPGYNYNWSNGSTTHNLMNVSSNTYTVTVTDNLGCTMTQSFYVSQPDQLTADVVTTPVGCDQPDGTITLTISGGVGDYSISSSEGTVNDNQILGLSAGLISVEIEDENGCIWSDEVLTQYIDYPVVTVTEGAEINCIQTTTAISGNAIGGYNEFDFQWTTNDGHIVSNPLNPTITVDDPGSYLLHVTDLTSGCETFATSEVISGVVPPDVDAGPVIPINCENLQVALDASGDSLNLITWTTFDGNIVEGGSTYHPTVNASGTYYIYVLNSVTNCTNEDSVMIPDESAPAVAAFQFLTSGLTLAGLDISAGSNLSGWNWTFGDGNSSTETNVIHTYSTAGTYEVCHSVQNGCGSSQICQMVEVTFTGGVILVDAVVTNVLCFGESTGGIILTVNGGSGIYTYLWTGPDTIYTTNPLENVPAGSYQLIISDDAGNIYIGGFNIEQPSPLALDSSTVVDNLCFGDSTGSVTLNISGGIAPYLYSWNGTPPQSENFISQLPGGIVNAVVTDSNGCVIPAGPYTIFEPPQIISVLQINHPLCNGDTNGSISLLISGGVSPYSYLWASGSQDSSITGLAAGNYVSTITDSNGCILNIDIPLIEPDLLEPKSITVTNASGPDQIDGAITLEIKGGTAPYQVSWSNGSDGITIDSLIPGTYNYIITDAHGCQYISTEPVQVMFITGTTEVGGHANISILPNPSDGKVIIKWSDMQSGNASLTLMNMDGKIIKANEIHSTEGTWDLTSAGLSGGLYIIMLKQNEEVYPFKLVVL